MKKTTYKILVLLITFFCFSTSAYSAGCNLYASNGKADCESHSVNGHKCKYDSNKKGGARCYESNVVVDEVLATYNSCTDIKESSNCNGSKIKGSTCIWRQGACYNATNDGTDDTSIKNGNSVVTNTTKTNTTNNPNNVAVEKKVDVCNDPNALKGFQIGGYVIMICKILAPLIIIITGISNLMKSVLEEKDSNDTINLLIKKIIVGVFIFFIPTIVGAIINLINNQYASGSKFGNCETCLLNPKKCDNLIYGNNKASSCTLFGSPSNPGDFAYYLQISFDFMKYAGLTLTIVLTVIDIIKALTEQDKELNKNLAKKFFSRMVIVIVLFFLPVFVNLIMSIINSAYTTCGIK